MTSANTREEIKGKDRTVSFHENLSRMLLRKACNYHNPSGRSVNLWKCCKFFIIFLIMFILY